MIGSHDTGSQGVYSEHRMMRGSVLIVDDDQDISTIVAEVLSAEGFSVSELRDAHPAIIQAEVARLEPDVVLLDGGEGSGYGYSWMNAAWMRERSRPIPVIMFTGHSTELAEAQIGLSERSRKAAFVGFLSKPFDLRDLVETVSRIVDEPAAIHALVSVGPQRS
jgi:DNA-binding NtrC family response regulator